MINPTSRSSLADLRGQVGERTADLDETALAPLADDLDGVGALLIAQPRLRRFLADGATPAAARVTLLTNLVGTQVGETARQFLAMTVELRWSTPWDFADAIYAAADEVLLLSAQRAGTLQAVSDELFGIESVLTQEGALAGALDDASSDANRRWQLLQGLLAAKVQPTTLTLMRFAVLNPRRRSILTAVGDLLDSAARIQNQGLARVTSARALSDVQQQRLSETLTQMYGRPIAVRVGVDPRVQGGLVIRVGDEIIDGSVASRLATVRAALAA